MITGSLREKRVGKYLPMRPKRAGFVLDDVLLGPPHRDVKRRFVSMHEDDAIAVTHKNVVRYILCVTRYANHLTLIAYGIRDKVRLAKSSRAREIAVCGGG